MKDDISEALREIDRCRETGNWPPVVLSDCGTYCLWGGFEFDFSPTQAAIIQICVEQYMKGVTTISQQYLLSRVNSDGRFYDLFRKNKCLGSMLQTSLTRKGTVRIVHPREWPQEVLEKMAPYWRGWPQI